MPREAIVRVTIEGLGDNAEFEREVDFDDMEDFEDMSSSVDGFLRSKLDGDGYDEDADLSVEDEE